MTPGRTGAGHQLRGWKGTRAWAHEYAGYWPPDDDEHPHASVTRCGVTHDKNSMAQVPGHRAAGEKQEVALVAGVGRQLRHQQAVVDRAGGQAALRCTSATTSSEGKTSVTRRRTASPL